MSDATTDIVRGSGSGVCGLTNQSRLRIRDAEPLRIQHVSHFCFREFLPDKTENKKTVTFGTKPYISSFLISYHYIHFELSQSCIVVASG